VARLLASLLALSLLACSKRAPPEPPSTTVDEAEFHLTLPGGWTEKKSGGEYTLASAPRRETVTASALSIPGEDPRGVVDQLVQSRRSTIVRASPTASVTRPTYEESGGLLRDRFSATDPAGGAFTSCLFVATKTRALTVVFYEYGGPDPAAAAQRADAIFATFVPK
jgi:hypothetical protein